MGISLNYVGMSFLNLKCQDVTKTVILTVCFTVEKLMSMISLLKPSLGLY